jgi:hypothetical protein
MEKLAAANAEMLARKEGKELVGRKTGGVKPMRSFPAEVMSGDRARRVSDTGATRLFRD